MNYDFPITGWPSLILYNLVDFVRRLANLDDVAMFYIGRTNDIDSTQHRHSADGIIPIYVTDSDHHAMFVEDFLIKTYYLHPKCVNKAEYGGGGGVSPYYKQYVYVAVWLNGGY